MNLEKLKDPFPPNEVEWRVGRSGAKDGRPWATVLAYLDARAVTRRLDEVCGAGGWRIEKPEPLVSEGKLVGFMVGISVKTGEDWVTKWDVADSTDFEAIKGGYSGAVRRAGAVWGIGKYLYNLEEEFCETSTTKQDGWNYQPANQTKGIPAFYWQPPALPQWAVPAGTTQAVRPASAPRQQAPQAQAPQQQQAPAGAAPSCPKCGGAMRIQTRKSDGNKFWSCTKWKETGCKGTLNIDEQSAPSAPATDSPEWLALKARLLEMGCEAGRADQAEAVVRFLCSEYSLAACKSDPAKSRSVIDEIAARTAVGYTDEAILNDAFNAFNVAPF